MLALMKEGLWMTVKRRFVSSPLAAVYHGVLCCRVPIASLDKRYFFLFAECSLLFERVISKTCLY